MSTEYTHFAKLAFDKLFAIGADGSETVLFNSSGLFIGSVGSLSSLILGSGTVASPSLKLGGLTTGLYSSASNAIDIAAGGIQVFNFSSTAIARVRLQIQDGTAASPGLNFQNDPDTGIYNAAADTIGVSTGGIQRLNISSAGVIGLSVFQGPNGTVSSPSFGFQNDPTSGIYRISSGTIGITTAGVLAATLSGSGLALVGRLALGGSAISTSSILNNSPTAVQNPLSGVTQRASRTSMVGTSAATTEIVGFSSAVSTEAVAFTTALRTHFQSADQAKGAGSTITRDLAFGGSIPTQGTNNALLADNTAFTGNYSVNITSTSAALITGPLTLTNGIVGQTSTSAVAVGRIGQSLSSYVTTQDIGTSAQYGNLVSISLTPGRYLVTAQAVIDPLTATVSPSNFELAISTNSGNTTTDHVLGTNQMGTSVTNGTGLYRSVTIMIVVIVASTTTYYAKTKATYTVATPKVSGGILAVRIS